MEILCDTCLIHKGERNKMSGPRALRFRSGARFEKGDFVYSCESASDRYYEQHHGYFNVSDTGDLTAKDRSSPLCQCREVSLMYIAHLRNDGMICYRCPCCSAEAIQPISKLRTLLETAMLGDRTNPEIKEIPRQDTANRGEPAREPEVRNTVEERVVANLAYLLWQGRCCPEGSPEADWFEAEKMIRTMGDTNDRERMGACRW